MNEKETTERSSDGLLSKRTLAPKLEVSSRTVDDWMRKGWTPFIKIGPKTVRLRLADVLEKLSARRVN